MNFNQDCHETGGKSLSSTENVIETLLDNIITIV